MKKVLSFPDDLIPVQPDFRRADDGCLYFRCCGPSMLPTLKPGDLIAVAPYASRPVRRGDLIVFRLPASGRLIAHRVTSVRKTGLRVRGDNNTLTDPWKPGTHDILGRVVRRVRHKAVRIPACGMRGDLYGRIVRSLAAARQALFRLFRPAYLWASDRGRLRRLLPLRLKTRLLAVKRPQGTELQLVAGRRVIARRPAGSGAWLFRRPFKLLVDVRSLPESPDAPTSP